MLQKMTCVSIQDHKKYKDFPPPSIRFCMLCTLKAQQVNVVVLQINAMEQLHT